MMTRSFRGTPLKIVFNGRDWGLAFRGDRVASGLTEFGAERLAHWTLFHAHWWEGHVVELNYKVMREMCRHMFPLNSSCFRDSFRAA